MLLSNINFSSQSPQARCLRSARVGGVHRTQSLTKRAYKGLRGDKMWGWQGVEDWRVQHDKHRYFKILQFFSYWFLTKRFVILLTWNKRFQNTKCISCRSHIYHYMVGSWLSSPGYWRIGRGQPPQIDVKFLPVFSLSNKQSCCNLQVKMWIN